MCFNRYTATMPVVPVDPTINARWIWPVNEPHAVLENHTLVIRDGRIADLVPSAREVTRGVAHHGIPPAGLPTGDSW